MKKKTKAEERQRKMSDTSQNYLLRAEENIVGVRRDPTCLCEPNNLGFRLQNALYY